MPNVASHADDLTIFVSSPRLDAAEAEPAVLLRSVSDWSADKKLGVSPGKSSVTLFIPRYAPIPIPPICHNLQRHHPLDKTPKILGITWDTYFTFSPHVRAIAAKATGSLCKALAGTN
jgi:hypothetical protein